MFRVLDFGARACRNYVLKSKIYSSSFLGLSVPFFPVLGFRGNFYDSPVPASSLVLARLQHAELEPSSLILPSVGKGDILLGEWKRKRKQL